MSIERDVRAIKSQVNYQGIKFNDFLFENSFGTISTAIESGQRLTQIDLASPGLKGKMLRYGKFVITLPDGSNPTVIELKVANLPIGATTIYIWVDGANAWEQDIFPSFGYPVGSLISGLDFQVNSVNAAASSNTSSVVGGACVQYNFGGMLSETSLSSAEGGNLGTKPFTFNPSSGEVQATKFKGVHKGNNIGSGAIQAGGVNKYWYLSPQDFMFGNDLTRNNYSSTAGFSIKTWQYYSSYGKFITTIFVPEGYKVISCFIKGSANWTWSAGVTSWSSASGVGAGSGVVNTEATALNWTYSSTGTYYTIQISGASATDTIYGARLTLEEV